MANENILDEFAARAAEYGTSSAAGAGALRQVSTLETQIIALNARVGALQTDLAEAQNRPPTYKVVAGDTLTSIANKFGLEVQLIRTWNDLPSTTITVGQELKLFAAGVPGQPTPPPDPVPVPQPTGNIFDEHVGFGNPRLTNPTTIMVTSNADSGPGTLRAAITGNAHKHIKFASDMVIQLSSDELKPGSNTLIDGGGRKVTILGNNTTGGFVIMGVSKVTLYNLTVRKCGNTALTGSNDPYDGVLIDNSKDVWVHHLNLSECSDKALAVQNGSVGVTVSWTHFHTQAQTFQIGSATGGLAGIDQAQTVTVHHNYFNRTGYRHPVVGYAKAAHVYNNYYNDFELYACRSERIAKTHFEKNVLKLVRNARVTLIDTPGNGCNDAGTKCDDREGFLTLDGNVTLPGSLAPIYRSTPAGSTFAPSSFYTYTAQTAGQPLADAIAARAGAKR